MLLIRWNKLGYWMDINCQILLTLSYIVKCLEIIFIFRKVNKINQIRSGKSVIKLEIIKKMEKVKNPKMYQESKFDFS